MTRPPPVYDPREIKDDDWVLRITRVGEKRQALAFADDNHAPVVEVTLTLSQDARAKQERQAQAMFAGIAVVILLLPLPTLSFLSAAYSFLVPPTTPENPSPSSLGLIFARLASIVALKERPWYVTSLLSLFGDLAVKALLIAVVWSLFRPRPVIQESAVALRGLGLQLKTLRSDGKEKCSFYDSFSLKSLLVHEGIQFCAVRYYCAAVVAGKKSLVLLFEHSRPRLPFLGKIYRALYPCLFPDAAIADVDRYAEPLLASAAMAAASTSAGAPSSNFSVAGTKAVASKAAPDVTLAIDRDVTVTTAGEEAELRRRKR